MYVYIVPRTGVADTCQTHYGTSRGPHLTPSQGSYFAVLLYRGCMLFVMFVGPFRYFYFRVRVRLLGHLLPTLAWGYVQHIYHEISPISFEN